MRLVVLESPYAANDKHTVQDHVEYGLCCLRDSLRRGEAPIASHLLYTQPGVLRDDVPHEREQGIAAGLSWLELADAMVVYTDFGVSDGVIAAVKFATENNVPIEYRSLENTHAPE